MNIGMTKAIATQAAKDEIAKGGLVIDNVARTGVEEVKSQLDEKANGLIFRDMTTEKPTSTNVICGYEGNAIAIDLERCNINGGGSENGRENVIGGNTANVNTPNSNNVPMETGTGANLARILGGYDNVINGLSSQISADHCKIENTATHCSILGGANHSILTNSDFCAINGGEGNTINADYSVIGGGTKNNITGNSSTISGGAENVASGIGSNVSGGFRNNVGGTYSGISSGNGNTNSGNYTFIGGGISNTVSALNGSILAGQNNQVTANFGTVLNGTVNIANGINSTVLGGENNKTNGYNSIVYGKDGLTTYGYENVQGGGKFVNQGDCQVSNIILSKQTTNETRVLLAIDKAKGGSLMPPENSTWGINGTVIGRNTMSGESIFVEIKGLVQRVGSGTSTLVTPAVITELSKTTGLTWKVELLMMGNYVYIGVTGEASKTINWLGTLEIKQLVV